MAFTIMTSDQMNKERASILESNAAFNTRVQNYLIQCAAHVYEHGDTQHFANLIEGARGIDAKRVASWAAAYGFTNIDAKAGTAKVIKKANAEADFADGTAVGEYLSTPGNCDNWWEFNRTSRAPIVLDLNKKIDSLVAATREAIDDEKYGRVDLRDLESSVQDLLALAVELAQAKEAAARAAEEAAAMSAEEAAEAPSNVLSIAAE